MLSTAWLLGSVQLLVTCAIDSDHIVDIKWLTFSDSYIHLWLYNIFSNIPSCVYTIWRIIFKGENFVDSKTFHWGLAIPSIHFPKNSCGDRSI